MRKYIVLENFLRQREQRIGGLPVTKTQGLALGGGLLLHLLVFSLSPWLLCLTVPIHMGLVIGTGAWEGRLFYEFFGERLRVLLAPLTGDPTRPFAELGAPPTERAPLIWERRGETSLAAEAETNA